ncbi:MAG: putative zinc-binding metallopeptidase, partial [Proteobacteria bacterium]|nr:putative zinc-binding metallopeptidase [Pseudomonadota bacterium]
MTQLEHPYEAQVTGFDFHIPDDVLLSLRVCDLGVRLENTNCPALSKKLLNELKQVGITQLMPKFYLADEWFCPAGSIAIAVPFWLAHPRLTELERTQMGRAEGDTALEFMKLLRHEMGHCVEHAYRLSERSDWQQVFGSPSVTYSPEKYQWDRKTRDFVKHLPEGYAQSHPEEDFAETFAVWLDPRSAWRKRYKYWTGAIAKLHYVHNLMQECAITKPKSISYNL